MRIICFILLFILKTLTIICDENKKTPNLDTGSNFNYEIKASDISKQCPLVNFQTPILLPSKSSCNEYYICNNGRVLKQKCPQAMFYNPFTKRCDFAFNVDCPLLTETNNFRKEYKCTQPEYYLTEDPTDFRFFYKCVHGVMQRFECMPSHYFNKAVQKCQKVTNSEDYKLSPKDTYRLISKIGSLQINAREERQETSLLERLIKNLRRSTSQGLRNRVAEIAERIQKIVQDQADNTHDLISRFSNNFNNVIQSIREGENITLSTSITPTTNPGTRAGEVSNITLSTSIASATNPGNRGEVTNITLSTFIASTTNPGNRGEISNITLNTPIIPIINPSNPSTTDELY